MQFSSSKNLANTWKRSSYSSAIWFKPKTTSQTRVYLVDKKPQLWGSESFGPNKVFETMRFAAQRNLYRLFAWIILICVFSLLIFSSGLIFLYYNLFLELIFSSQFFFISSALILSLNFLLFIYGLLSLVQLVSITSVLMFLFSKLSQLFSLSKITDTPIKLLGQNTQVVQSDISLNQSRNAKLVLNYKILNTLQQGNMRAHLVSSNLILQKFQTIYFYSLNNSLLARTCSIAPNSTIWLSQADSSFLQTRLTRTLQTAWTRYLENSDLVAQKSVSSRSRLVKSFNLSASSLPNSIALDTLSLKPSKKVSVIGMNSTTPSVKLNPLNYRLWCVQNLETWNTLSFSKMNQNYAKIRSKLGVR